MIHVDISVMLPVRDAEASVAPLVRSAVAVRERVLARETGRERPLAFELLALDERSGDNTASVLSVLHGQVPYLRTLQDLDRGAAIRSASRVARGDVWLVIDRPVDAELAGWAVAQVLGGRRAAIVPGEILVVHRSVGVAVLRELAGGLATAQRLVTRHLRHSGESPAFSPPDENGRVGRAIVFLRSQAGRVGLASLDRPWARRRTG
ncbi:MAG TPA: hypothetical protein VFG69_00545 [Nannocystaceae bacterium]|nr:hypothetical protein [Nannocystaceae bacterium]